MMINNKLVLGILAHVDAGKTTFSESILYESGFLRKQGRVDHQNAFLDNNEIERARGITIFSEQAVFSIGELEITLLDTPGHVDFSAEMERTLQVLDYAILIVSASDGVQGHTRTLWKLLKHYKIPTFIFVNKMDQVTGERSNQEEMNQVTGKGSSQLVTKPSTEQRVNQEIISEINKSLGDSIVDFTLFPMEATAKKLMEQESTGVSHDNIMTLEDMEVTLEKFSGLEALAICSEELMEEYAKKDSISVKSIKAGILAGEIHPCLFGSALYNQGVREFLKLFERLTVPTFASTGFAARVFKIGRDEQKNRMTFMKITGGYLKVKETIGKEKVNQIRVYSGMTYQVVSQVFPGTVCAVIGLDETFPGQGLGAESEVVLPVLEPVLRYQVIYPEEIHSAIILKNLQEIEDEEPMLKVKWCEKTSQIYIQLMGEIQLEILKSLMESRFSQVVGFGKETILYKETIAQPVIGVGHFEPLGHYSEVHLLMEPLEPGSGIEVVSDCSTDVLDWNWQKLILSHIKEREHVGVLTGSPITDIRITLLTGAGSKKHTQGGDFRQATYRGVRQGLKKAKTVILEPFYDFVLEVPTNLIGRSISDISKMKGSFVPPITDGENSTLVGSAPVALLSGYQTEVLSYTSGMGKLSLTFKGYEPCHNASEIIDETAYDSETDENNPTGSVFFAHGAGFIVPWYKVEEYMHLENKAIKRYTEEEYKKDYGKEYERDRALRSHTPIELTKEELDAIYVRTADPVRRNIESITISADSINVSGEMTPASGLVNEESKSHENIYRSRGDGSKRGSKGRKDEYLLVDGYNIIFAWRDLNELAMLDISSARGKLMDILADYQGMIGSTLILVFDAYRVEGGLGSEEKYHNIHVVYTKEAETADTYIEKTVQKMAKTNRVIVATSDATHQMIILGQGGYRLSARDLREDIIRAKKELKENYMGNDGERKNYLFDYLDEEIARELERIRLGLD
jgi:small GTP-binding protein